MNPEPIPISSLEHHVYCPRQAGLILVEGQWADNANTVRGTLGHRRADEPSERVERGRRVLRGVTLWSERHGLSGRADAVEVTSYGNVIPVEYKIGVRHGDAADVQLCAEALCLEEMLGRPVTEGALWLAGPRRRRSVVLDAALRHRTLSVIEAVRASRDSATLPSAVCDERCSSCQLRPRCLPELVSSTDDFARRVAEVLRR